jgi:glycerophosphoryl diester phosphodiesterase
MTKTVAISAHQGGSEHTAAATYEAYKDAAGTGAEYAEFDIRKTRDDVPVVYHDQHAGQAGPLIKDLPYEQLCDMLGHTVPRVEDVMRLLAGKVMGHLDLKEIGYEAEIINLALDTFGLGNFVVTSLEDTSILSIKQGFPEVTAALSLGRDLAEIPRATWASVRYSERFPMRRIRACRADWVAVNHKLARLGVLRLCGQNGIGAMVWTVDGDGLIDQFLKDERVDVLITNRPEHAVRRRADLQASSSRAEKP